MTSSDMGLMLGGGQEAGQAESDTVWGEGIEDTSNLTAKKPLNWKNSHNLIQTTDNEVFQRDGREERHWGWIS